MVFDHHIEAKGKDGKIDLVATVERHAADTETIEWVELAGPRITTRLTDDEKKALVDLLRA